MCAVILAFGIPFLLVLPLFAGELWGYVAYAFVFLVPIFLIAEILFAFRSFGLKELQSGQYAIIHIIFGTLLFFSFIQMFI